MNLAPLPPESGITIDRAGDGIGLSWPNPGGDLLRACVAIFGIVFATTQVVGAITVFCRVLEIFQEPPLTVSLSIMFGSLLMLFFVSLWLYFFLRPMKPEVVEISGPAFYHDTGRPAFSYRVYRETLHQSAFLRAGMIFLLLGRFPRKIIEVDFRAVSRVSRGSRGNIFYALGGRRYEVGRFLAQPDRDWLYYTLTRYFPG